MHASLLTRETLVLRNVPRLADVTLLSRILGNHGVDITVVGKKVGQATTDGQTFKLKAAEIVATTAPYEMVSRMRASFWVLAPLLARCGEAKVSLCPSLEIWRREHEHARAPSLRRRAREPRRFVWHIRKTRRGVASGASDSSFLLRHRLSFLLRHHLRRSTMQIGPSICRKIGGNRTNGVRLPIGSRGNLDR